MPDPGIINVVIDVSHLNGNIDFHAVKDSGLVGVIHKATEGKTFLDKNYAGNRVKATQAGLRWGAYHFGGGTGTGAEQASFFLATAKPDDQTLVALDFEENAGNTMSLDQAHDFINTIKQKLRRVPVLYGGSFLKEVLQGGTDPILAECPLWFAQYSLSGLPKIPPNWSNWTLWQYTDGQHGEQPHTVAGVASDCDRDKFNGDMDALLELWGAKAAAVGQG